MSEIEKKSIEKTALETLISTFPFKDQIQKKASGFELSSYNDLIRITEKYLDPGSKILDFGSGVCDKAGLLNLWGINVQPLMI